MGLAGPRNRRKLQHDPNNTKWTRDETTFGQKILRAQGWEPGQFLGAQGAAHSHLHTAASAAPITAVMKDDTLGLGAQPRHKQNTECTGLDGFKDLLGRLNGKSEEVIKKEREVRSGIKTNLYVERKYGTMRFVSGGLLVGDQMKGLVSTDSKTLKTESSDDEKPAVELDDDTSRTVKKEKKEKKSKKRKTEEPDSVDGDIVREKKRKRSKNIDSQEVSTNTLETEETSSKKKKSRKSKREDGGEVELDGLEKKKKKNSKKSKNDSERKAESDGTSSSSEDNQLGKSESKKEKKEKKEKKQKDKKDKKQKRLDTVDSSSSIPTPQESGVSTPSGTGPSTPQPFSARHYARSRNIASKRMAMADLQALNQIFMVKPV
ncbi:uncharacterized protein GGS25DRAFT_469782 [Hypoxylon fragiforme]|uniref:uncharacterized protein n=1 Tax=Hypoxylon fragiforme TaxID=63214 RepID=UPI0020C69D6D|nr:uncharacterized protein GGS25DRAFT_469782 [Hypoxylon fragiforme]KAI2613958.1 hypothetical protein GGS25DRAFT_469782 [Hypoxylon fragiforme]